MSDELLFIVNPASSGGNTARTWGELRRPIESAVGRFESVFTVRAGHAAELAREAAASGRRRIVAVGGDGTFSEVASGVLAAKSDAAVGLIHQGTGGDFRRSLGFEHQLDRYLRAIASGRTRAIDAGLVHFTGREGRDETRAFVNVASLGMGGLVDKYVAEGTRTLGGSAAYLAASLKALAVGEAGRLEFSWTRDGQTTTELVETRILAVCNGRYFGGGMEIAPGAALDDGLLDVVAITGSQRLPLLRAMAAVYRGEHLSLRGVRHWRVSSLSVRLINRDASDRFLLDVDGEWAGGAPVSFEVLPKALHVIPALPG